MHLDCVAEIYVEYNYINNNIIHNMLHLSTRNIY